MSTEYTGDTFVKCLTQQLCEFELLRSMYPNTGEITLTDSQIIEDINDYVNNKSDYTPGHLDFILKLHLNDLKLEVCVNLPSLYPEEEPDIYVRCNQLNRQQETLLNTELTENLKSYHSSGEVCLYTAISWLQENIDLYSKKTENVAAEKTVEIKEVPQKFVRLWIYSHHIYNKKKRDDIVTKAKELNLTGICLPGKPGMICIEGPDIDCRKWWRDIKSMSWKKIVIRITETFDLNEQKTQQKFNNFQELLHSKNSSRFGRHADMSGFSKYMEECGLSKQFTEVLGINNISS